MRPYRFLLCLIFVMGFVCPIRAQFEPMGLSGKTVKTLQFFGDTLYAGTDDGLYRNVVSGSDTTWQKLGLDGRKVYSFIRFSPDTLLAGIFHIGETQDTSYLFRTTNGGASWQSYQNGFGSDSVSRAVTALEKPKAESDTIFGGNLRSVHWSPNRGKNWHGTGEWFTQVRFIEADFTRQPLVFAGGSDGYSNPVVRKSTDGGQTWDDSDYYSLGFRFYTFDFHPFRTEIAYVGGPDIIKKTTNNGRKWSVVLEHKGYTFRALETSRDSLVYATGYKEDADTLRLGVSKNGGGRWKTIPADTSLPDEGLSLAVQLQQTADNVYIGTEDGLYRYTQTITSVKRPTQPHEFHLRPNYPNPFNPTTKIRYSLPRAAEVSLVVYDLLGRQVETIVHSKKPAGHHTATFNGGNISSGVYIYRLQTNSFSQTRKMLLIK